MSRPESDRNLLFAVLALQNHLVSRDDLLAALDAWGSQRHRPLADLLTEAGALQAEHRGLLDGLIDAQVALRGSASESLAALEVAPSVREAVSRLADAEVQDSLRLAGWADPEATGAHLPPDPSPGLRYRVLRPHAKGGLGEVFVARDLELGREVALKEIQARHAQHRASRGRFVLEAEITGGLEHPGIVPVYGLGTYEDGRPYYAMRFIKGDNLKDAARGFHQQHQANAAAFSSLEFRQLLGRFVDVCQAVGYAHSRGVLHRDLKPGNVMLGKFGETLVVDWGLAKVVGRQDQAADGEATLMPSGSGAAETVEGSALGTPGFMSPEQAAGKVDQLGPRTDIYSLGATLYALLTDRPPVEGSDVGQVLGKVRRGDWPAPCAVRPAVPLALDAVCRKAMALNPEGRYASALELAEDIEHWLADEPVRACRDPLRVRAGRWLRKHRTFAASAAVAAVVLMAALGAGLGIVGWFNRQLDDANTKLTQANGRLEESNGKLEQANEQLKASKREVEQERDEADRERRIAQAVRDFLYDDLLRQADPWAQGDRLLVAGGGFAVEENPTVRELLERAAAELTPEKIDHEFPGQPVVQAEILLMVGSTFLRVGDYEKAIVHLERARRQGARTLGPDHALTLIIRNNLAMAYGLADRLKEAIPLLESTLKAAQAEYGPDHPATLTTQNNLAAAYYFDGLWEKAIPLFARTLQAQEASLGRDHPDTLRSQGNLGRTLVAAGQTDKGILLLEKTLEASAALRKVLHPEMLTLRRNLASAYAADGQQGKAIPLLETTLRTARAQLGEDHPDTLATQNSLGLMYLNAGRADKAIPLLEQTHQAQKRKPGESHASTLSTQNNLAMAYLAARRMDQAIPLFEETLKARKATQGDDHPKTLTARNNLAVAYRTVGRLDKAGPLLEENLKILQAKLGARHPHTLKAQNNLAQAYQEAGWLDKAIPLFEQTLKSQQAELSPDHPDTLLTQHNLALAYKQAGELDKAIPLYERTLEALQAKQGADHPDTLTTQDNLARAYEAAGRPDKALPLYEQTFQGRMAKLGPDHPDTRACGGRLFSAYGEAKRFDKQEGMLRERLPHLEKRFPPDHPALAGVRAQLGLCLLHQKKYAEAKPVLKECLAAREKGPASWLTANTR